MKTLVFLLLVIVCCIGSVSAVDPWCGVTTLYFQNQPSPDITGYEQLINFPSGATETDEAVTVSLAGGTKLIDTYISPMGSPNAIGIEKGLRRYRTFGYVDKTTGITRFNFTPFIRYANGTERNLYTVMSPNVDNLAVAEILTPYVSPIDLEMNPTARLGIKVSANTTSSASVILHWVYEGSYHYSTVDSGNFICAGGALSNIQRGSASAPSSPLISICAVGLLLLCTTYVKRK
jgi:hypothetical protein